MLCVCGHFIPYLVILLPRDATGIRAVAITIPPLILDALWAVSIENVLDHAAFVAIASYPDSSVRKGIRKADSLNTVVKAVVLKLPSVMAAMTWALVEAGFAW
ncbi:hypothetical protein FSARC_9114 [Fusarium sarcochroum]|uniref:Uncharacterized protein n=1 Tax=Fusarium sarcochroum TaxID=1208366 RepID=A0A8H4TRL6_9HYPO|nr:hypothetical protein FSARC_9114 [Fusarium sarcochroum]